MIHSKLPILALTLAAFTSASAADAEIARLPAVTSSATSLGVISFPPAGFLPVPGPVENRAADETGRPEWTSHRRFTTTRVYLQKAPWEVGCEQWYRVRQNRDHTVENLFQHEIEIGLPGRMQLDIYENWVADGSRRAHHDNVAFELRFAFADWGKIPGNPTLYAEYKLADAHYGPDVYEFKLLLGDALTPRLHWALNGAFEQEIGGERATEFAIQGGLSYTVIDGKLGVGIEAQYKDESMAGGRGEPRRRFLIGPSIQWRPTPRTHLDFTAQWGTNGDAQNFEGFVVFGIDFGRIGGAAHYQPTAGRSN